jgi:hypothetical protein
MLPVFCLLAAILFGGFTLSLRGPAALQCFGYPLPTLGRQAMPADCLLRQRRFLRGSAALFCSRRLPCQKSPNLLQPANLLIQLCYDLPNFHISSLILDWKATYLAESTASRLCICTYQPNLPGVKLTNGRGLSGACYRISSSAEGRGAGMDRSSRSGAREVMPSGVSRLPSWVNRRRSRTVSCLSRA